MKYKLPELSIFFPVYNEAGNIEEAIKQALFVAPKIAEKHEIIVVDDGSRDATLQIARRLARTDKHVRVVTQYNKGYGGALKLGFKSARYDWVFYTDADLQFDISELKKFIRFTKDHDMIIGYRKHRVEGWKRQILASALKIWNKVLLNFPLRIRDIDCAFKLMHKRVIRLSSPLISDGAMASTELLLKAYFDGFAFKQIGVNHFARHAGSPTGSNWKVILRAVRDTFTLQKHFYKQSLVGQFTLSGYKSLKNLSYKLASL